MKEILNLINVKYFCDAVRFGGVSAAAKVNFVTQSAISQGISKLEQSLEISLLARHPNRFVLTSQGEALYARLIKLLENANEIHQGVAEGKFDYIGDLVFACTYSFALAIIPSYLKRFKKEHPHVKITFTLGERSAIKALAKTGTIDFGILPDENDLSSFEKRDIYLGKFRIYSSYDLKIKNHEQLDFILTEPNAKETIFIKKAYYAKYQKELEEKLRVDSWEAIANLVAVGVGVGYFPDYIAQGGKKHLLQECKMGIKTQKYQISAISPKGMQMRKSSEIFLSYFVV